MSGTSGEGNVRVKVTDKDRRSTTLLIHAPAIE